MSIKNIKIRSPLVHAVSAAAVLSVLAGTYYFSKWSIANMASTRTDQREMAEYTASLSPSDPQTHFAAAVILEKTFLPADFERSLEEYERAAALAPSNYLIWLELGKALDRHGEYERAEKVLRYALEMAPHYSQTKWTLGNYLLRRGDTDEAFEFIRQALAADPKLAEQAVQSSYSWFDGDISRIRTALSGGAVIESALIRILIREKRLDEAFNIWLSAESSSLPDNAFKEAEAQLLSALVAENKYRSAYQIYAANLSASAQPAAGTITNGDFEEPIKMGSTIPFEWQVTESPNVQAAIIEGQRRSGSRSLRILFNATEAVHFRSISQTVAVEPGRKYRLDLYYRSGLKTEVPIKWQITDTGGKPLAESEPLNNAPDWKRVSVAFTAPATADAVALRLAREQCVSAICPITGSLFIDDVSITTE